MVMKAHSRTIHLTIFVVLSVLVACAMARRTPSNSTFHLLENSNRTTNTEALLIDSLIACHQHTIDMANQALKNSSMSDVKVLAEEIKSSRQMEIQQLLSWRKSWYPNLGILVTQVSIPQMKIPNDNSQPFDSRFLAAMIPQNKMVTEIAEEAKRWTEHAELQAFLDHLLHTQETELADLKLWQSNWYGNPETLIAR